MCLARNSSSLLGRLRTPCRRRRRSAWKFIKQSRSFNTKWRSSVVTNSSLTSSVGHHCRSGFRRLFIILIQHSSFLMQNSSFSLQRSSFFIPKYLSLTAPLGWSRCKTPRRMCHHSPGRTCAWVPLTQISSVLALKTIFVFSLKSPFVHISHHFQYKMPKIIFISTENHLVVRADSDVHAVPRDLRDPSFAWILVGKIHDVRCEMHHIWCEIHDNEYKIHGFQGINRTRISASVSVISSSARNEMIPMSDLFYEKIIISLA